MRFTRLFSIIETGNLDNEARTVEALQLGFKLAADAKCLGMWTKLTALTSKFYKRLEKNPPPSIYGGAKLNDA
jgi:hypothetical protein